jgi:hypothetical protein
MIENSQSIRSRAPLGAVDRPLPTTAGLGFHWRCLGPADNFYEWKTTATGKQPYAVALADRRLIAAGKLFMLDQRIGGVGARNRWFADSLLEGSGFEPSVPRDTTEVSRGSHNRKAAQTRADTTEMHRDLARY